MQLCCLKYNGLSNFQRSRRIYFRLLLGVKELLILSLACSFGLLLALYAGLFVVLSLTKLGKDSRTSTLTLKTTERTVKRLAVFYFYFCHLFSLPSLLNRFSEQILTDTLTLYTKFSLLSILIAKKFGNFLFYNNLSVNQAEPPPVLSYLLPRGHTPQLPRPTGVSDPRIYICSCRLRARN